MATTQSHPDANLHPSATGRAATLVNSHQHSENLKLYSGWFCPFVQRIWTVLEEKKIPYQYIEVNPYHKPESLLKLNPRGLVPTLEYEGKPLYESVVILEFLEEAYPHHGLKLLPEDVYERARVRIWTDFVTSRIIPSFHRFLQFQPMSDGEGLKKAREEFLGRLREMVVEMEKHGGPGPWFTGGKEPGLVDFVVGPWIVRLWVFDHFKEGLGVPKAGESGDDAVWARFRKWEEALHDRPSFRDTMSEKEHYLPIYARYAKDEAQSELAKATRQGRGVP